MAKKKTSYATTPDDVIPIYKFYQLPQHDKTSVCGFITDFLPLIKCNGIDHQIQITIKDIHEDPNPDPSNRKPNILVVKLFAQDTGLLPPVERTGDVIYFKRLKVSTWKNEIRGLSTFDTTFALFPCQGLPNTKTRHGHEVVNPHGKAAVIRPTSVGDVSRELQDYAIMLGRRFSGQIQKPATGSTQAVGASSGLHGSGAHPLPPRPVFLQNQPLHVNQSDSFYDARYKRIEDLSPECYSATIIGEVVKIFDTYQFLDVYVTDYTSHSSLYNRQEKDTVYDMNHPWAGPTGRMTLKIELHDPHRNWVRMYSRQKDILIFRNVRCKMSRSNAELEGTLWPDRKYEDKVHVGVPHANDMRVQQLEQRRREYNAANGVDNAFAAMNRNGNAEEQQTKSKKRREKKLRKERERQEAQDGAEQAEKVNGDQAITNEPNDAMVVDDVQGTCAQKDDVMVDGVVSADTAPNGITRRPASANPRVQTPSQHSFTIFTEVVHNPKRQMVIPLENGISNGLIELPFINVNHRVLLRVVDYHPKDVWSFARPLPSPNKARSRNDYEWSFTLLVASGSEGAKQEVIPMHVDDEAGNALFGVKATSIIYDEHDQKALAKAQEKFYALVGSALPNAKESSSNESSSAPSPTDAHAGERFPFWARHTQGTAALTTSSPFEACIREYGVRCEHAEDGHDDVNDERPLWERCICGWRRVWGLHSTRVVDAEAVKARVERPSLGTTREEAIVLDDSDEEMGEG